MLELKTKGQLATEAQKLTRGLSLVRYRGVTYIPADFETRETAEPPAEDHTIWLPLSRDDVRRLASERFDTLFATEGELSSFEFMTAQSAQQEHSIINELLVRTPDGLRMLNGKGQLQDPHHGFVPNTLVPMLNTDPEAKKRVRAVLDEWLDSEEETDSLLAHLATGLAPGWSAVRYVLLLGEGRNGKSTLLKMLHAIFGRDNVSHVTRQQISEQSPVVTELNGKLLNIVYDGQAEYLKDSGTEKSLIAGEPAPIRRLYESTPTMVQTNALYIEGLQTEPKSKDKSSALQKRLVRFQFPNVYAQDHKFERLMLSEESLGALLALLIDHYVLEDEVAERLAPTTKTLELQLEHMYINSIGLQFLKHLEETDPFGALSIVGMPLSDVVKTFQSWRISESDLSTWAEPDVVQHLNQLINTERKSMRIDNKPRKVRIITSVKPETRAFLDSLKEGGDDAALLESLVDD